MPRFVLSRIDPATDCVRDEVEFQVVDVSKFVPSIGEIDGSPGTCYRLDAKEHLAIVETFGLEIDKSSIESELVCVGEAFILDPNSHTRRELALMLEEKKPLAVFTAALPATSATIPEDRFAEHVTAGRFLRFERRMTLPTRTGVEIIYVFFVLPGEEWRVPAYWMLMETGLKLGWNDTFEALEKYLLGYDAG